MILESNNKNAILVTTEKDYCRINESYKNNIECAEVELEINNKDKFIELLKKHMKIIKYFFEYIFISLLLFILK